jgi:hypothetical protein
MGEGWQPIETAPKDGTNLLMCSGDHWMTTGSWNKWRGEWCINAPGYPRYGYDEQPTHWQSLPASPSAQGEE